jgi:hypothetical protein
MAAGAEGGSPKRAPFATLVAAEARLAMGPRHLAMLGVLAGFGVLLALWMPHWPEPVYRFFTRIFHLAGWSEIVLVNNLTGILFCLYWLGAVDLLRVTVQPLEEGYLDLLLSKPVGRCAFMLAKVAPSFAVLLALGAVAAVVHAGAMVATGLVVAPNAYAGAVAVVLGLTMLLLALANLLMLTVRDSFAALVVAFVPFMAAMLPGVVYMYRPDAYDHVPVRPEIVVVPVNLLWRPEIAERWGALIALGLVLVSLALVALAAHLFQRRDLG